jgi:hypothetical protein
VQLADETLVAVSPPGAAPVACVAQGLAATHAAAVADATHAAAVADATPAASLPDAALALAATLYVELAQVCSPAAGELPSSAPEQDAFPDAAQQELAESLVVAVPEQDAPQGVAAQALDVPLAVHLAGFPDARLDGSGLRHAAALLAAPDLQVQLLDAFQTVAVHFVPDAAVPADD